MPLPEDLAERWVTLAPQPCGSHHVRLAAPGCEPVLIGPYPNPAVAREKLDALRHFVAAVIRHAATQAQPAPTA